MQCLARPAACLHTISRSAQASLLVQFDPARVVSSFFLRCLWSICFTQREREGPNHPVYMLYLYRSRLEATERGLVGLLGQVGWGCLSRSTWCRRRTCAATGAGAAHGHTERLVQLSTGLRWYPEPAQATCRGKSPAWGNTGTKAVTSAACLLLDQRGVPLALIVRTSAIELYHPTTLATSRRASESVSQSFSTP